MKKEQIINLAMNYIRIWNAGHENLLDEYAHKDIKIKYPHFQQEYYSINEYKKVLQLTHHYFPDLLISVTRVYADVEEKIASIEWTYTGTHKNEILYGIHPSGKTIKVHGISLIKIKDDKVISETGIVDNLSLIMQLGVDINL